MVSKHLIYFIFILLPIVGLSQKDSLWRDSIHEKASLFFTKVDKIELIKLEPYCQTKKYPVGWFGRLKKVEYCTEESILRYNSNSDNLMYPIDSSRIGERYNLQLDEFESLFEMLYIGKTSNSAASCYNPRHGIIFYNSAGDLIGFLEICFECSRIYALQDTPNMGPLEGDPFKKLQLFFTEKNL